MLRRHPNDGPSPPSREKMRAPLALSFVTQGRSASYKSEDSSPELGDGASIQLRGISSWSPTESRMILPLPCSSSARGPYGKHMLNSPQ